MVRYAVIFILLLCVIMVLGGVGCGIQRGRFKVTGSRFSEFSSPIGGVGIIKGFVSTSINTSDNSEQDLLYVLLIGSSVGSRKVNVASTNESSITTLDYSWTTKDGLLRAIVSWNRQTDEIVINNYRFSRENGNFLVITLNIGDRLTACQLPNLGLHDNPQHVLEEARKRLPDDALLKAAQMAK